MKKGDRRAMDIFDNNLVRVEIINLRIIVFRLAGASSSFFYEKHMYDYELTLAIDKTKTDGSVIFLWHKSIDSMVMQCNANQYQMMKVRPAAYRLRFEL